MITDVSMVVLTQDIVKHFNQQKPFRFPVLNGKQLAQLLTALASQRHAA